jgi:hypothetical protein
MVEAKIPHAKGIWTLENPPGYQPTRRMEEAKNNEINGESNNSTHTQRDWEVWPSPKVALEQRA